MRAENRGDEVILIQRPDQLNLVRPGQLDGPAGPDGDTERMRTAQYGVP
jgi:hypothetical protein